ncbi:type II toxin-antitoxin system HicA family toxin [Microbacterium sp. MAHUQ-60]|uniref:type II toxin-antitoxin system HicA family toxin n=1 Tax=unclassified Microbacterium TaxID=2609290 RepID=UPI00361340A6
MVSEQPTRKVTKLLKRMGWRALRTVGSHTTWEGPNGTTFTLPDGHSTISPGVFRKLLKALDEDKR